jgi:4-amino-4-deoxy-L-arabinose transferase-like glycosyltransferase
MVPLLHTYETGTCCGRWDQYFNGPFYFMVFTVTARLFQALNHRWLFTDGLHLTNLLVFLAGLFFFYRIALRLLPRGVALFATALYATQPVLFGHGFINQKDTPLMAFFLASVETGWRAVESSRSVAAKGASAGKDRSPPLRLADRWKRLRRAL